MMKELNGTINAIDKDWLEIDAKEVNDAQEVSADIENNGESIAESPDIPFIERTSRIVLLEQCSIQSFVPNNVNEAVEASTDETKSEGLTDEEKAMIKEETGWSDEIIENIKNMKQYEILKKAGLVEGEINDKKCLIKKNIDLDYEDNDGITNRHRMALGLAPLDSKTGKPIELHHLGQKADSPLVELTEEEHRTGEYEDGKLNQSLWHDNTINTEVHSEGNTWNQERKVYWKERAKNIKE